MPCALRCGFTSFVVLTVAVIASGIGSKAAATAYTAKVSLIAENITRARGRAGSGATPRLAAQSPGSPPHAGRSPRP